MNIAVLGIKGLPATAGADRVVEKLLEHASAEHRYCVYVLRRGSAPSSFGEHVEFVRIPSLGGKHLRAFSFFLLCTVHYLLKGRYDLAHVHNSDFGCFLPLLRLKRGVPIVGTFHGDPYTRRKWGPIARAFLRLSELSFRRFASRLTSVSKLKTQQRSAGDRTIEYIPNGVDPYWQCAKAQGQPPLPGLTPKDYVLFACGRLDATKGLHRVLDAYDLADLRKKLVIVGDFAHDPAYSRAILRRTRSDPRMLVHKQLLGREALLQLLGGCSVFVFPSEYEAMSMMLLEAVSCKAPVVCSDIRANMDIVGPRYPYAFPTFDTAALAACLESALNETDWQSHADRLYERCMKEFAWAKISRKYEALYAELCAAPAAAAPSTLR